MKINIDITEEVLEQHLLRVISRDWDVDITKNQFRIKGGIIDILARSKKNRDLYFVIEVKTGDIKPDAVCQVLRYTLKRTCFRVDGCREQEIHRGLLRKTLERDRPFARRNYRLASRD